MLAIIKETLKNPLAAFQRIKGRLAARKDRQKHEKEKLKIEQKTKHLTLSVAELFMQENTAEGCNRYDIIVRLLAIECEKGSNDYGWDLYRKMQESRMGTDNLEGRILQFKKLICSYDNGGYDTSSEIEVDSDLHLIDGSHRMAMALYHNLPTINVKVRPYKYDCFYGIEFFKINGFSKEECNIIQNRYKDVLKAGINQAFICTLWHPIRNYFDEITKHLELFGKVLEVKDFVLSEHNYRYYTKSIYHVDDIADWKVEKKIGYMIAEKSQYYQLRMIAIELTNPDFRLKGATNGTLSRRCEFIKQLMRNAYKKKIDNYFHDIIMHIGDNFYQNEFLYHLMSMPSIDVKTILSNIRQYNYVLTKTDVEYMPSDFPAHYPLGKDIDIICADKYEYDQVLSSVKRDIEKYGDAYNLRFIEKKDENSIVYRTLLRLELENMLVFQFDIAYRIENLPDNFSIDLCNKRIEKNGYYIPELSKELIVRIFEVIYHPEKTQHIKYIKDHIYEMGEFINNKYLTNDARDLIAQIKAGTLIDESCYYEQK